MVEEIFNNKGYKPEDLSSSKGQNLIEETYRILEEGVNKGITQEIDEDIVSALKENTFIFSGFKTHQELKEVSSMLLNEDGSFRSFEEYLRDVFDKFLLVHKKYYGIHEELEGLYHIDKDIRTVKDEILADAINRIVDRADKDIKVTNLREKVILSIGLMENSIHTIIEFGEEINAEALVSETIRMIDNLFEVLYE